VTNLDDICASLRAASTRLALQSAEEKNRALLAVRDSIDSQRDSILQANARDVERARSGGMSEPLIARLALSGKGIDEILAALSALAEQTDPIGQVVAGWSVPNGLGIRQVRVPLGVAAVIYESRPNVTVDAFALAYKSANAVLLRGSSSALESNRALVAAIKAGLAASGGEADAVELSEPDGASHADVDWILAARGKIDIALPRGGASLIRRVVETARVPVIETGAGVCHLYVDPTADLGMAVRIADNARVQKPAACNSLDCVLVHRDRAAEFFPALAASLSRHEAKTGKPGGVEFRCDARSLAALAGSGANAVAATEEDWGFEFLDYVLACRVVDSLDEAIDFINAHGTRHSETIVTESRAAARSFQARVDAACVYVNASPRFTDGGQFGLGAEIGISTQKLHARGPMGLTALTTTKYLVEGEGQVRP